MTVAIFQPSAVLRQAKAAPLRSDSLPSLLYLVAKLAAIAVLSFRTLMLASDRTVRSNPDAFRSLNRGAQNPSTSSAVE